MKYNKMKAIDLPNLKEIEARQCLNCGIIRNYDLDICPECKSEKYQIVKL